MRLWSRIIFYVAACFAAESYGIEPDVFVSLSSEAVGLKAPLVKPHPDLGKLSGEHFHDGVSGDRAKTPEVRSDRVSFDFAVDRIIDPSISQMMLLAGRRLAPQSIEDSSRNLFVKRQQNFNPHIQLANRKHIQKIHSLPRMSEVSWAAMRREVSTSKHPPSYFAGRPITDYCAAEMAKSAPTNAPSHIAVLDMAVVESTRTSLELSLLHLLDQPDPFSLNGDDDSYVLDSVLDNPWQVVLKKWMKSNERIKNLKLKDFMNWWQKHGNSDDIEDAAFAKSMADVSIKLRKDCAQGKGIWEELNGGRSAGKVTIFSCKFSVVQSGFELFMEQDPEFEEVSAFVFKSWRDKFVGELRLDPSNMIFALEAKVLKGNTLFSPVLLFDRLGRARGRVGGPREPHHLFWDEAGLVRWSGRSDANNLWTEDMSWTESGAPAAKMTFSPSGDLKRLVEWYGNGLPSRLVNFDDSKPSGLELWWNPSGKAEGEIHWYDGKKFGSARLRFENGHVAFDGSFVNDELDGPVTWRDELGREVLTAVFRFGDPDGSLSIKNGEGITLASAVFDRGRVEGMVTIGVDGNRAGAKLPFKSGLLDGEVVFLDSAGRIRMTVPYRSGKLHGEVKGFYEFERRAVNCSFDDGHMTSWMVHGSKLDDVLFNADGKISSQIGSGASVKVSTLDSKIEANCQSRNEAWSECIWTINKRSYTIKGDDLKDRVKRNTEKKGCSFRDLEWNLEPWLEQNAPFVLLNATPIRSCSDKRRLSCRIMLTSGLPLTKCEPIGIEQISHQDDDHDL